MSRGTAAGRCKWCGRSGRQRPSGAKILEIKREKLHSINFKLFSQTKGNSINNCDFL
jgi:hypothetical protein